MELAGLGWPKLIIVNEVTYSWLLLLAKTISPEMVICSDGHQFRERPRYFPRVQCLCKILSIYNRMTGKIYISKNI